jgi:putative ABC transport system permease protein
MTYSTEQRTHEIGIRMALGASRSEILRLVLGSGMLLTLLGLAIGVFASFGVTRLLQNLLYAVKPTDPVTFMTVLALLAFVALIASFIPAWKASREDPILALRHD